MSTPTYKNVSSLIEMPDSGAFQVGDRWQLIKRYRGKLADCVAALPAKGTVGTGDLTGYLAFTATVQPERGGLAILTITWDATAEGGGGSGPLLPADQFGLEPVDLNPSIEKHPEFDLQFATVQTSAKIRAAGLISNDEESTAAWNYILDQAGALGTLWGRAQDVAGLMRRGVQNYYLSAFRYFWTLHSWDEPTITRGGVLESPGGPLADAIAALDLSCLRQADALQYQNGTFILTRSWLCAPDGQWAPELYDPTHYDP